MLKRILAGIAFSTAAASAAALLHAQGAPPPPQGAGAAGAQAGTGRGRGGGNYPTKDQWDAMPASAKAYVDKASQLAGTDPDLKFDMSIFCRADGGASNEARATVGVPASEPKLTPYPAPSPKVSRGGQRLFETFYWFPRCADSMGNFN